MLEKIVNRFIPNYKEKNIQMLLLFETISTQRHQRHSSFDKLFMVQADAQSGKVRRGHLVTVSSVYLSVILTYLYTNES